MDLCLNNVCKKYKKVAVVDDFNFTFTSGIYALIGPNGSGKTTLMRMICDVLNPSSGKILLDGIDIKDRNETYREHIGYLPQKFGFYPNFTGWDFMMYISLLKGIPKNIATEKCKKLLEFVDLQDVKNIKVKTYSGGMLQRLGIAQALINSPDIIVMDEPTVGLDPQERNKFKNILSELSKDKIIIISTHITSDIEYIADHVLIMSKGKLVLNDNIENICNTIEGYVWKCMIADAKEISNLEKKCIISNIRKVKENFELRMISKDAPITNAENVSPNLEELYLYYFKEKNKWD